MKKFLLPLFTIFLFISCKDNKKTETESSSDIKSQNFSQLDTTEIRSLVKDVYIYSFPMIMNYYTMYTQAVDSTNDAYAGGFGKFRHYGFYTYKNRDIVSPNNDTPYSWAWLDLRDEPWVLYLPSIKNRYYTSQWDDLYGYVLDNPGAIKDGTDGGYYLIAAPDWKGELPAGIKRVIKGESTILGTLTRTGAFGEADLVNVRKIQRQYKLIPLHEYLKKEAPAKKASPIKWIPMKRGDELEADVFKYVNFILPYTIPNDKDKAVNDKLAKLGIGAGKTWDSSKFTPEEKAAVEGGIKDAIKELMAYRETLTFYNRCFGIREQLKDNYTARALGVILGIFGNQSEQAVYSGLHNDDKGQPFDARNGAVYKMTFKKEQIPNVKYFWSLTMYDINRFMTQNDLNRYSLGSREKSVKINKDGSIDFYFSHVSPGKEFESNWLPAPDALFLVAFRNYGPDQTLINETYKIPPVVKIK
nr:DUF1254 domain-containing protein [Flavobacterium sp. ASV13]